MNKQEFSLRLSVLRKSKGVSARKMSLSIGQSTSYIKSIENGTCLPSVKMFFRICEYLEISEQEFFNTENVNPKNTNKIISELKSLDADSLEHLLKIINLIKQQ